MTWVKLLHALVAPPLGPFIISLVSNSIPFISLPYLLAIIGYVAYYKDPLAKIAIVISSALGAALGKLIIYFVGRALSLRVSEHTKENIELFRKLASKSLFIAIFTFAALPLPDDVLYLPTGMIKYSLPAYFIAVLSGKLVLTSITVLYGSLLFSELESVNIYMLPVMILITLVIAYYILNINWSRVINEHMMHGLRGSAKALISEIRCVTLTVSSRIKTFVLKHSKTNR